MFEKRVKFIDYNGCYPCLCQGVLTVEIEGKKSRIWWYYKWWLFIK
jgi:hypothetical protein